MACVKMWISTGGFIMELTERKIYGERIKQGRLLRGLSQKQLAEKMEVSKQAISGYETNKIKLSISSLKLLPEVLELPLSFFYKKPEDINEDGVVFFRTKDIPKKTKSQLREEINIMDKEIVRYFERYVHFPEINLPNLDNVLGEVTYNYDRDVIIKVCKMIRELWGLGNEPIDNLTYILQINGFIINKQQISQDKTDGFSQRINDKSYIFVSSNKESAVRTRFDLAHELGHLVLHNRIDEEEYGEKSIERDADFFASELLYPSEVFLDEIQEYSLNFDRFIELKEKWRISIQAIVRKCKDLDIISDDKYIYFQKRISFNKWRRKEPLDERITVEEPRLFRDVIELLIDNDKITKKNLLMDIDLYKKDIIKYCNLKKDFFDDTLQNVIKIC